MMTDSHKFEQRLSKISVEPNTNYFEMSAYQKRSNRKYKYLCVVLICAFVALFSYDSFGAECIRQNSEWTAANLEVYRSYQISNQSALSDCLESVVMSGVDYAILKHDADKMTGIEDITPESIAESFGWGFGTYISFWWLGYVIRNAKMVIKRV